MEKIEKILLIRMSSIGDVILTTPVIRQLRQKYPAAQIDFLIRREFAGLVKHNPHLSNVIEIHNRKDRREFQSIRERIRHTGYDVILDLHRNIRSRMLCRFSGHPPVLKIKKQQVIRFLLVNFKIDLYQKFYGKPLSVAEKYLRAAQPLGVSPEDQSLEIHLPPAAIRKGEKIWRAAEKDGFGMVMAPGARHFTKRWPPEYYAELIRMMYEKRGWKTLLAGGPDEAPLISEIRKAAGEDITRNLAGKLSLSETFALVKHAPFFISNDSGLMHAAAACGIPQIAIFGSTTRELGFFPINPKAVVLENSGLSCRPCTHIGRAACPRGHFKCMKEITPQMVSEKICQSGS